MRHCHRVSRGSQLRLLVCTVYHATCHTTKCANCSLIYQMRSNLTHRMRFNPTQCALIPPGWRGRMRVQSCTWEYSLIPGLFRLSLYLKGTRVPAPAFVMLCSGAIQIILLGPYLDLWQVLVRGWRLQSHGSVFKQGKRVLAPNLWGKRTVLYLQMHFGSFTLTGASQTISFGPHLDLWQVPVPGWRLRTCGTSTPSGDTEKHMNDSLKKGTRALNKFRKPK